jgi:hypothetical protein
MSAEITDSRRGFGGSFPAYQEKPDIQNKPHHGVMRA